MTMLQRFSMRRFASSTTTSPLSTLLAGFKPSAHHLLAGEISEQWMQGQTTFGGLSAALCLTGARQLIREAETQLPLRSAQILFLGAAGGAVTIDGEVLRRGKSSAFVRSEVSSFGRVATSSTFAFCKSRPSQVDTSYICPPASACLPPPSACESIHECLGASPAFMQNNFELRVARRGAAEGSGSDVSTWMWARHRGTDDNGSVDGVRSETHLLTLADTPPPALLFLLPRLDTFPNVSSLTWHVDFCDNVETRSSESDGWWLIEGRTETARQGYSAAVMTLWGHRDDWHRGPLIIGRQTIAVYI